MPINGRNKTCYTPGMLCLNDHQRRTKALYPQYKVEVQRTNSSIATNLLHPSFVVCFTIVFLSVLLYKKKRKEKKKRKKERKKGHKTYLYFVTGGP